MDSNTALTLTDDVTADLVRKKVTCPFLGSAVHQKFLAVRGEKTSRRLDRAHHRTSAERG
jgi:hypothetical protein